ncbi:hypothetical protein V1294_004891 [Bradyrhizobium sp. AZCC 1678]
MAVLFRPVIVPWLVTWAKPKLATMPPVMLPLAPFAIVRLAFAEAAKPVELEIVPKFATETDPLLVWIAAVAPVIVPAAALATSILPVASRP